MESVSLLLPQSLAEAFDKRSVKVAHVLASCLQAQEQVSQFFRISRFFV